VKRINSNKPEKLFEDEDLVIINKPPGMLTIPDRFNKDIPNLYIQFQQEYGEIFIVHRLDRGTSGIMVFAKNAETHRYLNIDFQNHNVKKVYHCVCSGMLEKDEMDIDIPILPNPQKSGLSMPSARGKEALTKIKVIEHFRIATLVECNLITGRHHQIRVHLSAIGHPLFTDELYGRQSEFFLSTIKKKYHIKKDKPELPIIARVSMHSHSLGFKHPRTQQEVAFEADYPKDFKALLQSLAKYSAIPAFLKPDFDFRNI